MLTRFLCESERREYQRDDRRGDDGVMVRAVQSGCVLREKVSPNQYATAPTV